MMGFLAANATVPPPPPQPVCQVFAAGNYVGNCAALGRYFAPPVWYTNLWEGLLVGVIVLAVGLGYIVWREGPMGRYFRGKKGIKALMHFHGAPGVWGILSQYLDKVFLFESSGSDRKKTKIKRLIPAVPDAITHLRQMDGGDSFVLIQGDKGLPVSPELEGWAETHLGELAESHDWNHFALKIKRDMINRAMAEAKLFPTVKDWNPGTQKIMLVKKDGTVENKTAAQVNEDADAKAWYIQKSEWAGQVLADGKEALAKTNAILNGEGFYVYNGVKVNLPPRKKTEWVETITEEIANLKGEVGRALLGGSVVGIQYVANVLSNIPDGIYFDAAKAEVEEKVRKEMKNETAKLMEYAIVALLLLGGIGFLFYVFAHFGH